MLFSAVWCRRSPPRISSDYCMPGKRRSAARPTAQLSPFRSQHGDLVPHREAIADADGAVGRPEYTSCDWLNRQFRKGKLLREDLKAAERFREDVARAGYEQLRAVDLTRPFEKRRPVSFAAFSAIAEEARRRLGEVMEKLGGWDDPSASITFHVVGLDMTIAAWARTIGVRGVPIQPEEASGLLLGNLSALRRYYGL